MATIAKANSDAIGAVAALAMSAFLLMGLALVAYMFANANTDSGQAASAQAALWIGRLMTLPMPLAIVVSYFSMARRVKFGWFTAASVAPGIMVAALCVWLGGSLSAIGDHAMSGTGGPVDGAAAMGAAFVALFVFALFVGGAPFAALCASFGAAKGLGWPMAIGGAATLLGLLSFASLALGLLSFASPSVGVAAILVLAGWWAIVGVSLWRPAPTGP